MIGTLAASVHAAAAAAQPNRTTKDDTTAKAVKAKKTAKMKPNKTTKTKPAKKGKRRLANMGVCGVAAAYTAIHGSSKLPSVKTMKAMLKDYRKRGLIAKQSRGGTTNAERVALLATQGVRYEDKTAEFARALGNKPMTLGQLVKLKAFYQGEGRREYHVTVPKHIYTVIAQKTKKGVEVRDQRGRVLRLRVRQHVQRVQLVVRG